MFPFFSRKNIYLCYKLQVKKSKNIFDARNKFRACFYLKIDISMIPLTWEGPPTRCEVKDQEVRGGATAPSDFDITPPERWVLPARGHKKVDHRIKLGLESEYVSIIWIEYVFSLFFLLFEVFFH